MVLVNTRYSCISRGTEMSGLETSGTPIWKRALRQPEKAKTALKMLRSEGLSRTRSVIQSKLGNGQPTGYSAAGIVLEVGEGVDDIRSGDRVACAGAQCAYHAEVIRVPRNLVVPVTDAIELDVACTVTLGAIALQGVRRAQPTLGETFAVIGLGVVGQLVVQILRANGCRVVGIDIDKDRIELARDLGMDLGVYPQEGDQVEQVGRLTGGIGVDGVIVTASSPSDAVVSSAFQMSRRKGRVVVVGEVGLNLNRRDIYYKELDFFISTSYGPGRYDENYEEKGIDYPVGYVRWTENRNMSAYLNLIEDGKVNITPLIGDTYPIENAAAAYGALGKAAATPMVLLSYPHEMEELARTIANPTGKPSRSDRVRVALVGAGEFAKLMHLPNIKALSGQYHLQAVMSHSGHNATTTARQFGATYATTDYDHVLNDEDVDAVIIATRHNLHASMALDALKAGKHVLVEKPLALNGRELSEIEAYYSSTEGRSDVPILLTGFNRRFSQYALRIHELTERRSNPMIINYRMNAGFIPLDKWLHTEEGGGRNLGEACHIYDLFTYLTNSKVVEVSTRSISPSGDYYSYSDNFVATMSFEDGSIATLMYSAMGSPSHPKEQMDVFVDGSVITLNNYVQLSVSGKRFGGIKTRTTQKGHKEELEGFAKAIRDGGEWPIALWEQVQATEIALKVEEQLGAGR